MLSSAKKFRSYGCFAFLWAVIFLGFFFFRRGGTTSERPVLRSRIQDDKQLFIYLAASTLFRNEQMYIREWIEFHRLLGFDHFLLFNHNSTDNFQSEIQTYVSNGLVSVLDAIALYPQECDNLPNVEHRYAKCQKVCFAHAIRYYQGRSRWLAIFDVDEFLFPTFVPGIKVPSIPAILNEYEEYDVLDFTAAVFGSSGFVNSPQWTEGDSYYPLVLENYKKRAPVDPKTGWEPFQFGHKAIANPNSVSESFVHAFSCKQYCYHKPFPPLGADLRMSHYQYKSQIDSNMRAELNNNPFRSYDAVRDMFFNSIVDEEIQYLIPRLKNALDYLSQTGSLLSLPRLSSEYDRNLFKLHSVNDGKHPEIIPKLCVTFLSCQRLPLLRRTISSFIKYMSEREPLIQYEIALADNGSDDAVKTIIQNEFPLDTFISYVSNVGIGAALNSLFFGVCRSPYVLSLEDDWEIKQGWGEGLSFVKMSMDILDFDSSILEIWLRDFTYDHPEHQNRTEWINLASDPSIQYKKQYAGAVWGSYTNGASLKNRNTLLKLGPISGFNGEKAYALRVKESGLAAGFLCHKTSGSCTSSDGDGQGLFQHIGTNGRSPGHKVFEENVGESSPYW